MNDEENKVLSILREKYCKNNSQYILPPEVFKMMRAHIIDYDVKLKKLIVKFPILKDYENPFGNMQGGMIAAAIDNTLGPLSMMHAPQNYTRKLEVKFKKVIHSYDSYIMVEATVESIESRRLHLNAKVYNNSNELVALAKAMNWII